MQSAIDWTNQNSGFLTLVLFLLTLFLGWISGIFKALMHKPKFQIGVMDAPTFLCTFATSNSSIDSETHRTAAVIYLKTTNIGSAPSQIISVQLGYHNHSFKYTFLWYWLDTAPSVGDFGHTIGDNVRVFPFLFQKSYLLPQTIHTYLQPGQNTKGVVYFEQPESWGSFRPSIKNGKAKVKIRITDSYGKHYSKVFKLQVVDLDYARKFNGNFGKTLSLLEENPIEEWSQV